ncbi:Chromosome partition protein smc [hydrothermal vent metagenome]|uniref:Chromosome partition protein smc n=1 Tax=hydrothermal vent metagenome TaxID=652676 RepID=A0A3B0T7H3_9ZZZZ
MKFQRLRLHGFKSFCDPTDLVLEAGLTGVVGPNGCGKSNLMEAMRWVMGESSYKAMRASGMDDVIFSGSANRPARNSAEVTLVLDNSDRTAPAPLNNADILEVTRRIERESGSVYRVNGREVRARDVQLLFADASTGAHSPALVGQGRIGALIAAKPVRRRALLEEAAGISGLYSRRHEAELRLRGAEQNLERVEDIAAQIENQLASLKRQARLALRYRNISGDIRKTEASLFHGRWIRAQLAEKEATILQGQMVAKLAQATHQEQKTARELESARQSEQPLREKEAASGAAVQRLKILYEQLEAENRRASSRRNELASRQKQVSADIERETELVDESDELLKSCQQEKSSLLAQNQAQQQAAREAGEAALATESALRLAETKTSNASETLAQLRARRAQAQRGANEAAIRARRLEQQINEVDKEGANIAARLEADQTSARLKDEMEAAQHAFKQSEEDVLAAEKLVLEAQGALEAARPELEELESQLTRLKSEAETLARVLNVAGNQLWPAIADQLKVAPGYERALGAALGDDLDASLDSGAPVYWAQTKNANNGPEDGANDPYLPPGAIALSRFVDGAGVLKRRLDQVGVVSSKDGPELMEHLLPGQRLVSESGNLWRWDGLVSKADAPSAAAQRLAQRNRLIEIDTEATQLNQNVAAARLRVSDLRQKRQDAQENQHRLQLQWRNAQRLIAHTQNNLDIAQKQIGDLVTRQSALEEARIRLQSSLSEARAIEKDALGSLSECENETEAADNLTKAQAELQKARLENEQARLRLGNFENARKMRLERIAQLDGEMTNWLRRKQSALARLQTLKTRAEEIAGQLQSLAQSPDQFADKRSELDNQLELVENAHKQAADLLSQAQTRYRQADHDSRTATRELGEARAELARIDERVKGLIFQRRQIEQTIQENLGMRADKTREAAAIKPGEPLGEERAIENRLERLKAERERLGGVNLSAESEMNEIAEKLETMLNDRDDLIAAISKLRTGISSLNKQGRARLNEAFDKVNAHFGDLFISLFGGGEARLIFVESDDPLEAGLEILARPPGKKTQVLSLLSGGEQALTAMALIFAVFLTNPAPICVLDEVDAPLDDANVERFCNLLDNMCLRTKTRFLVITHNPITMSRVSRLFGVTMAERGVSQLVSVDLDRAKEVREAS